MDRWTRLVGNSVYHVFDLMYSNMIENTIHGWSSCSHPCCLFFISFSQNKTKQHRTISQECIIIIHPSIAENNFAHCFAFLPYTYCGIFSHTFDSVFTRVCVYLSPLILRVMWMQQDIPLPKLSCMRLGKKHFKRKRLLLTSLRIHRNLINSNTCYLNHFIFE